MSKRVGRKSLFLKSDQTLILASTSAYRRALLSRLGLAFEVAAPHVDETPLALEHPREMTVRLARAKARAIAENRVDAWVIGSDQAAACGARLLGKPGNSDRCIEQLQLCSGNRVEFFTAVSVMNPSRGFARHGLNRTRVTFRHLSGREISRYVEREAPFDCAGGFKCEGLGISLFESIDSDDPTALIGLPLIELCRLLRHAGFDLP